MCELLGDWVVFFPVTDAFAGEVILQSSFVSPPRRFVWLLSRFFEVFAFWEHLDLLVDQSRGPQSFSSYAQYASVWFE